MPLFRRAEPTGVWWRDHSLSLVLLGIMAAQTGVTLWAGRLEWAADPGAHHSYLTWWTFEYAMSLVADTFGVLLIVLLSKWFVERGSVESN